MRRGPRRAVPGYGTRRGRRGRGAEGRAGGADGGGVGMAMVVAFLLAPSLGVLGNWNFADFPKNLWAQIIAFGILLLSVIWYFLAKAAQQRRGINVDYAFKEIPPE